MVSSGARRLVTSFGTVAYVDPATLELRHGPIASSPANLELRGADAHGQLVYAPDPVRSHPVTLFSETASATIMDPRGGLSGAGQCLCIDTFPDQTIALSVGGLFTTAEPDGRIALSRIERRLWETFLPLDPGLLAKLCWVAANSWVIQTARRIITPDDVRFAPHFRLLLGDLSVDMRAYGRPGATIDTGAEPSCISVLHDGWKIERLLRYQPLIYFAAFGEQGIFDCLEIALASLARFADWAGRVVILTDRAPEELAPLIPDPLRSRVHLLRCNPVDVLGFTLARYALQDVPLVRSHQPLLYVDTDVVFDGNLSSLMIDILLSGAACFLPEREMFDYDFYGEPLFQADGSFAPEQTRGLSSGAIGIPTLDQVADQFDLIVKTAQAYVASVGNRDVFCCYDQPFANYVFQKLGGFDTAVLPRHAILHHSSYANPAERRGFVHFCGGVGMSAPKLIRMAQYYDDLAAHEPAAVTAEAV